MRLTTLALHNFRNFHDHTFSFDPTLTIIAGKNAVGKTNLLEGVSFSLSGNGFREEKEEELIRVGEKTLTTQAQSEAENEVNIQKITITISPEMMKQYFFNKIKKTAREYIKYSIPVVVFSPSFLYVIDGAMQERRGFFDRIISRTHPEYKRRLGYYEQAMRKRNKLLEKIADVARLREQLVFWDEYLIKEARFITEKRKELVDFFNQHNSLDHKVFTMSYHKNEISAETLDATFDKQFLLKKTLVGPQRDIFELSIKEKSVHRYGSRSEQRLTLFWLIINEMRLYETRLKKKCLVLLDDIFSELDVANKSLVLDIIKNRQTVITTIEEDFASHITLPKTMIRLE